MDTIRHNKRSAGSSRVTRRAALRGMAGTGIAATVGLAYSGRGAADHMHPEPKSSASMGTPAAAGAPLIEPTAGFWKTWILKRGDQLRPDAPPNPEQTSRELSELHRLAASRAPETWDRISYWDAGSPGYRWNEEAMQLTRKAGYGPGDAYRVMALLNVAIYDATIACWDAKYAYRRARPATGDPTLQTAIPTPASPAYPCEHAVTAGAASTVLAHLFPEEGQRLSDLADEASRSRMEAGVAHESDITIGLKLGKQVGDLVVAYAKADGSDAAFDPATMPSGPGIWAGDPVYPMLGTWKTWVLTSGSQFRPGPPPAWDSPERATEIAEVKNYQRDSHPFTELFFWPGDPSGRPAPDSVPLSSNQIVFHYAPVLHFLWGPELAKQLFEYRWDANPPRAARAYALVSIASLMRRLRAGMRNSITGPLAPTSSIPRLLRSYRPIRSPIIRRDMRRHSAAHPRFSPIFSRARRPYFGLVRTRMLPRASGRVSTSAVPAKPALLSGAKLLQR